MRWSGGNESARLGNAALLKARLKTIQKVANKVSFLGAIWSKDGPVQDVPRPELVSLMLPKAAHEGNVAGDMTEEPIAFNGVQSDKYLLEVSSTISKSCSYRQTVPRWQSC